MKTTRMLGTIVCLILLVSCNLPTSRSEKIPDEISVETSTPVITLASQPTATEPIPQVVAEDTQIPDSAPASTLSPPLTPGITSTPLAAFDFRELNFLGQGGGGADSSECVRHSSYQSLVNGSLALPHILLGTDLERLFSKVCLCVYGFPLKEWVSVQFIAPDGQRSDITKWQAKANPSNSEPVSYIELKFRRSLSLPHGVWKGEAWLSDRRGQGEFVVGGQDGLKVDASRPFDAKHLNPLDPYWNKYFTPGEIVHVNGVGWPSNSDLPVGIYFTGDRLPDVQPPQWKGQFLYGQVTHTTVSGAFSLPFTLDYQLVPGGYVAVPIGDPTISEYALVGDPVFAFGVRAPQNICQGALPSLIELNMSARATPGQAIYLRDTPQLSGKVVAKLLPYHDASVKDGPRCADNLTWWLVQDFATGLEGWTTEGDARGYWLLPIG